MAFKNPLVSGEEIVRSGIKSRGFLTGVSGWRIARDGAAEFASVILRGTIVLDPIASAIVLTTKKAWETAAGFLSTNILNDGAANEQPGIEMETANYGHGQAHFFMYGGAKDNSAPSQMILGASQLLGGGVKAGDLPLLIGVAGGTPDPTTQQTYVQIGSVVVTTSGNGDVTVTWPTAFPNNTLVVSAMKGESLVAHLWVEASGLTASSAVLHLQNAAGVVANATVRTFYVAWGY